MPASPLELDSIDDALAPVDSGARQDEQALARARQRTQAEMDQLRAAAHALPTVLGRSAAAEVVVTDSPEIASVLRLYAGRCLVLELDGEPWEFSVPWLQQAMRAGSDWIDILSAPLTPRAAQTVETLARLVLSGQQIVVWSGDAMAGLLALLEARGASVERLRRQVRVAPPTMSMTAAVLTEWFRLGCPGEPIESRADQMLAVGRRRWAAQLYEEIFPLMLSTRGSKQLPPGASPIVCSRPVMNLLIWLRDGSETALRSVLHHANGAHSDAGVIRCSARLGMLLAGVTWKVTAVARELVAIDETWIGYVHSEVPAVHGQLAAAGWGTSGGDRAPCQALRNHTLAGTVKADAALVAAGLISPSAGGQFRLAPDVHVSGETNCWRRGTPTTILELVRSTGVADMHFDALAARLAYHFAANNRSLQHGGLRRRIRLTLQRATGLAEMPPPAVVLTIPEGEALEDIGWIGRELSFHWAMPVDRRRRELAPGLQYLDLSSLVSAPGVVPTTIGTAALGGLLSVDAESIFYGPRGETLSGYLWGRFAHVFQPEYNQWIRGQLDENATSMPALKTALQRLVTDLATILR